MARVPSNRPSPSAFPRPGAQESSFNLPQKERRRTRCEGKRQGIWRKREREVKSSKRRSQATLAALQRDSKRTASRDALVAQARATSRSRGPANRHRVDESGSNQGCRRSAPCRKKGG
jgi:hypothetical protein